MSKKSTKLFAVLAVFVALSMSDAPVSAVELHSITYQNHPSAIAQQYIVTFDDAHALSDGVNDVIAQGGDILHTYNSINGFAVNLPDEGVMVLQSNPAVTSIEADRTVSQSLITESNTLENPVNWGLDRIDGEMDQRYDYTSSGLGVNVYVLDSGINAEHEQFSEGQVVMAYDALSDEFTACHNHGTGVGSVIAGSTIGVAPSAKLHSVRVLNCNLEGRISTIIRAMDWLVDNAQAPAVANMSIGTANSSAYRLSVARLVSSGITVVAAAGNVYNYDACNMSPGGEAGVITVAASDADDTAAYFTAMGRCVDLFAPGVDIIMASNQAEDDYWTESGTSFSTPHVTGCVARYLEINPTASPDEVLSALVDAADDTIAGALGETTTRLLQCVFEGEPVLEALGFIGDTVDTNVEEVEEVEESGTNLSTWVTGNEQAAEANVPLAVTLNSTETTKQPNQLIALSVSSFLILLTMAQLRLSTQEQSRTCAVETDQTR